MAEKHNIAPHGDQNKSRAQQSHHIESQTAAREVVAGYDAKKDITISLTEKEHQQTLKPQRAQRGHSKSEAGIAKEEQFRKEIGTSKAIKEGAKIAQAAGVPETTANRAALMHDGYMKGTTPLDKVKGVLNAFWENGGKNPKTTAKSSAKAEASVVANKTKGPGISAHAKMKSTGAAAKPAAPKFTK